MLRLCHCDLLTSRCVRALSRDLFCRSCRKPVALLALLPKETHPNQQVRPGRGWGPQTRHWICEPGATTTPVKPKANQPLSISAFHLESKTHISQKLINRPSYSVKHRPSEWDHSRRRRFQLRARSVILIGYILRMIDKSHAPIVPRTEARKT